MRTRIFAMLLAAAAVLVAARAATPVDLVRVPDGGLQPQMAVDAQGGIHLLYFKGDPAHGDLFYTTLGRDGTFSRALRVNHVAGSAMATGTMRGGHLAIGRDGRVHVAWHGSDLAAPRAPGDAIPVLYTRLNTAGTAFEPERNVVVRRVVGLDGGTVAADASGHVYVAWHAFEPGLRGEEDRRVWIARSDDDGRTFQQEEPASPAATGACGCCGVGALADRQGALFVLYRAATQSVHRDTYLLTSRDRGASFRSDKLQEWNIGACPMSSYALAETPAGVVAAWETDGAVQWTHVDPVTGAHGITVTPPGSAKGRKHPAVAANAAGETILVWTEGTSWAHGGGLAWQVFGRDGRPISDQGRVPGIPAWSLAAVAARADGRFVIAY